MADRRILVTENGKTVPKQSKTEDWDFNVVRIGADSLPISETDGDIDFNGAAVRVGAATSPTHAASKDQLDTVQALLEDGIEAAEDAATADIADLQSQIDVANVLISAVQSQAHNNSSAIVAIFDALSSILGGAPTEDHFTVGEFGQSLFASSLIEWDYDNALLDITVFVNGKKQRQSITGDLDQDFRKTSRQELEFSTTLPENSLVTVKNYSPVLARPYFRNYVAGVIGRTISAAQVFTTGTDRLGVYRNGIYLMRSATLGFPVDRYIEQAAISVELGEAAIVDDVYAVVHREKAPTFKQFQTGVTGTTLTLPTYVLGTGRLSIYRNGMLLNDSAFGDPIEQYVEDTTTTITLAEAAVAEDYFVYEFAGEEPTWREDITASIGVNLVFSTPYVLGTKKLLLFRNGRIMYDSTTLADSDERYQENTTNSVTLEVAAEVTDIFTAIYQ